MRIRRSFAQLPVWCLLTAFTGAAGTAVAQINGTLQGGLVYPATDSWNYGAETIHDYSTFPKTVYQWWGCGTNSSSTGVCYARNNVYQGQALNINYGAAAGLCDLANPSVVKFNGAWYMYTEGIPDGNPGCPSVAPPGKNTRIYAFISYDAVNWSILNNGQPVIQQRNRYTGQPQDTQDYGIGHPSAVVFNANYSCSGGVTYSSYSPHIRVYYTQFTSGCGSGGDCYPPGEELHHLFAKNAFNGVSFTDHVNPATGKQGILTERGDMIWNGWWPSVKKVGILGQADYPLVITWSDSYFRVTAVTETGNDFRWRPGNYGAGLPLSPQSQTTARLESLPDGTLIGSSGGQFTGAPSGQVQLRWSETGGRPNYIYLGQADTATWFPWSTSFAPCP